MVIVANQAVDTEWRNGVAAWVAAIGSLYVITWGVDCRDWHDAVDWANLDAFDYGSVPDERHIVTTWHDDEPLSEAFWFAGHCAEHPDVELEATLILHVAQAESGAELLRQFEESQDNH